MASLKKLEQGMLSQVQREYSIGFQHVNTWRQDVQAEVSQIKESAPAGKVKIDLVKENIDFERATFLTDEIDVRFVSDE